MAHWASKRSWKYLEKYLRERAVPLYDERLVESSELAERAAARTANSRPCWLGHGYPNPWWTCAPQTPQWIATVELNVNLAGVPPVSTAGLVIYLI